jgi:hypothetical protein
MLWDICTKSDSVLLHYHYVSMLSFREKVERKAIAEVVGSTPTLSIFINLVNYGIVLRLF